MVDVTSASMLATPPAPWLPVVVVAASAAPQLGHAPDGADIALCPGTTPSAPEGWVTVPDVEVALARLADAVAGAPHAAVTLAQVLRAGARLAVADALVLESLAYSTLQAGAEFATWLAGKPPPGHRDDPEDVVLVERASDVLTVTLNRPHVRNAVNARLRDELCAAFALAVEDATILEVVLRGAGPSFSSGGDLDEFGTLPDPVTAHLVRTTRSPARLLAALADRVTAHVHGACVGAGIELAAFAGRVVAAPDSRFRLPELGLGLIPGAGGTVSIRRRVGRQRTAFMGIGGDDVDVERALAWGLVDEIADDHG